MSLTLVLSTLFALDINIASAATSGQCTSTINWSYDTATKTLTLTGRGAMPDYRATNIGTNKKSPWETEKIGNDTIKSIMEKLVVGEGITNIGEYNFFNCAKLSSVSLPSTIKSIDGMGVATEVGAGGYGAFQKCVSLEEIALPSNLTTIEDCAFKECTSLKSISFPNSVTSLGKGSFTECSSLETVSFGTGLTTIGKYAFSNSGVKRINWGALTEIPDDAFYACNMKDIEFPQQIKSIGNRAFANNTSLMTVKVNNASMEFKGTNSKTSNNFSGSNQSVTIIGHSQSTAQTFANNYDYTFVSMDDCDHLNTRTEIVTEPTCTEAGLKRIICNDCEFVVSETAIESLGHDFVLDAENDATELDGHIYRSYHCSRCEATNETVEHAMEKAAVPVYHVWVEGYYEKSYLSEPTCTTPGVVVYTCTVDGCVNALGKATTDRKVVNSEHKVLKWTETPATCTEDGKKEGVCTVCGEKVTETIKATGHKYDETDLISVDKNDENGHTYYSFKCKNCGRYAEELEHNEWIEGFYERNIITPATCTVPGLARDTCSVCGETRTQTIMPTGQHDYEETGRTEPTCTTRGTITYKCKNCDQQKREYISATGHAYVLDEESSVAPTCTESGRNVYICSVCNATKTDTLPATGHTPIEETYSVVTQPTCTKTGLAVATCSVCNSPYEETVEALGHDYVDDETDLTDEGKPGHVLAIPTCTRCGFTDKGKIVHKEWIEGYYTTSQTSLETCENTYKVDTCTICNELRRVENPGLGHEYIFVNQTYEGVTLLCRHCASRTLIAPQTLLEYWEEIKPVNTKPNRTATDNSGYLDMDGNRILNAKDYGKIVNCCTMHSKLNEEYEQKRDNDYLREYLSGGVLTLGSTGKTVEIKDEDETITPGYEFTFTPSVSGTYSFYSTGTVDTYLSDVDLSALEGLNISDLEIGTSEIDESDAEAALVDTFGYLTVDGEDKWAAYDDNGGYLRNFKITYDCEEGVTYRIRTGLTDAQATGSYIIKVVKEGAQDAEYARTFVDGGELSTSEFIGKEVKITDSNGFDFTFTPTESGKYRFYSASTKQTFAYFEIDGEEGWVAYDEGGSLNTFSIEYECEAGKTYHLKTGFSDESQTGTFRVFVVAPIET